MQVRLTMDLSLGDWRKLKATVQASDDGHHYPMFKFTETIGDAIRRCEEKFCADAVPE